jgi:hypothetical protein
MKNTDFTLAKLLTFQFSFASLLMFFLLVNSSPSPGEGRGDSRLNDQNCTTAPTATLDKSLLSQQPTVTTVEVLK